MDMVATADAAPPSAGFDYAQLDDVAAGEARAVVERYRDRQKAYVIETGRDLLAVKARLEHGVFLEWVRAKMQMTPRSAQRAMSAAEVLGDKSDTVSYLPPTVLYELAAPSTPEPLRSSLLRRIEAGEAVKPAAIMDEVREAKEQAKKEAAVEREKARQARLTPEQREYEELLRSRGKKRQEAIARKAERDRAQVMEARRAEEAEAQIGAAYLLKRLGADEIAAFFARFDHSARYRIFDLVQRLAHAERARDVEPTELRLDRVSGSSSYDFIGPEEQKHAQDLAQQFEAGAPVEPVVVVDVGTSTVSRYQIVEGEDRYHALRGVLGRQTIPSRIAPPVDPAAVAAFDHTHDRA